MAFNVSVSFRGYPPNREYNTAHFRPKYCVHCHTVYKSVENEYSSCQIYGIDRLCTEYKFEAPNELRRQHTVDVSIGMFRSSSLLIKLKRIFVSSGNPFAASSTAYP